MSSAVHDFTDPDEAAEFLTSIHGAVTLDDVGPHFRFRLALQSAGSVMAGVSTIDCDLGYELGRADSIRINVPHSGSLAYYGAHDAEERFAPGDIAVTTTEGCRARALQLRMTSIVLDADLVADVAMPGARQSGKPVVFTSLKAASPAGAQLALNSAMQVRDIVLANPVALESPLVVAHAARMMAAVLLTTVPNTAAHAAPALADSRDANGSTFRRGVAFMEANAHRDVSLAQIAAAAAVTPRALQLAFRREAQCTPWQYLRTVRLARAHAELRAAEAGSGATVGEIARRWGFGHQGRFATAYRQVYGVSPTVTLRGR
ncbi:helix-turn-helix transcriptional regulator [Streptomyces sp. NPDC047023]|uniref:helix-turn-helix transcriptional regulator n=1 Tax=Streptomyces sp. NPDC047023 TaxID=3155139 RepID=UPI0033C32059